MNCGTHGYKCYQRMIPCKYVHTNIHMCVHKYTYVIYSISWLLTDENSIRDYDDFSHGFQQQKPFLHFVRK